MLSWILHTDLAASWISVPGLHQIRHVQQFSPDRELASSVVVIELILLAVVVFENASSGGQWASAARLVAMNTIVTSESTDMLWFKYWNKS